MQEDHSSLNSSSPASASKPRRAFAVLDQLRRRLKRALLLDGLGAIVLIALAAVAVSFVLDYSLRLPWGVRAILVGLFAATLVVAFRRKVLAPLQRSFDYSELAALLERSYPELQQSLVTAVELSRGGETARYVSTDLLAAVVQDVESRVVRLGTSRVVNQAPVWRRFAAAGVVLAVLVGAAFWRPDLASVWLQRNLLLTNLTWPQMNELELESPSQRPVVVAVGDDLPITVRSLRRRPSLVTVTSTSEGGKEYVDSMSETTDGLFTKTFQNVSRPFSFTVEGGDASLGPFLVEVRLRPRLDMESIRLWFEFPAYLGLASTPPDEPVRFGNLKVPVGTRVRFDMAANGPVQAAYAVVEERRRVVGMASDNIERPATEPVWPHPDAVQLAVREERFFSGEFTVEASGYYFIQLETVDGFRSLDPEKFRIEALPDRSPAVVVERPVAILEDVTPQATVTIRARASDDYGIESGQVAATFIPKGEEAGRDLEIPLEVTLSKSTDTPEAPGRGISVSGRRGDRTYVCELRRPLAELVGQTPDRLEPDARLQFILQMRDHAGNLGETDPQFFRVVSPEELTQALNRQLGSVRDALEELRERQASVRKDTEELRDHARIGGSVGRGQINQIYRLGNDQGRVRAGLERQAQTIADLLQRAADNVVGELRWREWVRSLGREIGQLASDRAPAIDASFVQLRELVDREQSVAAEVSPQSIVSAQRRLENDLELLIARMTNFSDVNAFVERLRELRQAQQQLLDKTRAVMNTK